MSVFVCMSVSTQVWSITLLPLLVPALPRQKQSLFTRFSVTTGMACLWEQRGHGGNKNKHERKDNFSVMGIFL